MNYSGGSELSFFFFKEHHVFKDRILFKFFVDVGRLEECDPYKARKIGLMKKASDL